MASGQELLGVDLELSRGARIRGRALFEDGPPATGVTAWIEGAGSRTSTLVDVHGFFDVSGLAPGQWRVLGADERARLFATAA